MFNRRTLWFKHHFIFLFLVMTPLLFQFLVMKPLLFQFLFMTSLLFEFLVMTPLLFTLLVQIHCYMVSKWYIFGPNNTFWFKQYTPGPNNTFTILQTLCNPIQFKQQHFFLSNKFLSFHKRTVIICSLPVKLKAWSIRTRIRIS